MPGLLDKREPCFLPRKNKLGIARCTISLHWMPKFQNLPLYTLKGCNLFGNIFNYKMAASKAREYMEMNGKRYRGNAAHFLTKNFKSFMFLLLFLLFCNKVRVGSKGLASSPDRERYIGVEAEHTAMRRLFLRWKKHGSLFFQTPSTSCPRPFSRTASDGCTKKV